MRPSDADGELPRALVTGADRLLSTLTDGGAGVGGVGVGSGGGVGVGGATRGSTITVGGSSCGCLACTCTIANDEPPSCADEAVCPSASGVHTATARPYSTLRSISGVLSPVAGGLLLNALN